MTDVMVQNAISSSVVGITRHVMETCNVPDYEAYRLVSESKTFALLSDPRSRLFLLTNVELSALFDRERDGIPLFETTRGPEGAVQDTPVRRSSRAARRTQSAPSETALPAD